MKIVLVLIAVLLITSCSGSVVTSEPTPTKTPQPTPTPQPTIAPPQLEILGWHWSREYSYIIAEGEVKNISGQKLDNVLAVMRYYTEDGTFVTSDDALIDFTTIMPGQTSPFKVYTSDNPLIKKGRLSFSHFMGGSIPTKSE